MLAPDIIQLAKGSAKSCPFPFVLCEQEQKGIGHEEVRHYTFYNMENMSHYRERRESFMGFILALFSKTKQPNDITNIIIHHKIES